MRKFSLFSLIFAVLVFCSPASAFKTKIYRMNKKRTKIMVSARGFRGARSKMVTANNGCEFKVLRVKRKSAMLRVKSCPSGVRLRKGMIMRVEFSDESDDDFDSGGRSLGGHLYKGLRVSLMKALSASIKVSTSDLPIYGSGASQTFGMKVHFASIPRSGMGYDVAGVINLYNDGIGSAMHLRLDANGTYSVMKNLYVFPGVNLNKPFSGEQANAFAMGFGFQLGVGYKFGENMGVDFAMVNSSNKATTVDGLGVTMGISTMELGFNYQF